MTLDTRIFVKSKVDQREVFDKVNEILHIENPVFDIKEDSGPYSMANEGTTEISNRPMQGFCAWVMTYYNPDGLRFSEEYLAKQREWHSRWHDENSPEYEGESCDCRKEHEAGDFFMEISVDTGYGFRGDEDWNRDWSCTMLHTWLLIELGSWFESRGIDWAWMDEYSSKVHHELTQENLEEFNGSGAEAFNWFHGAVLPAIHSKITGE